MLEGRPLDDSAGGVAALNAVDGEAWVRLARSGDFEAVWQVSDRIRRRAGGVRDWSVPRHLQQVWDGQPFADRRVLIRCYHGLGDTIQFIRYAPRVRAVARDVAVWAQPALLPLLRTMAGIDRLLPLHDGSPEAECDVDVEVMELPYAFRTTLADIPAQTPYLFPAPSSLPWDGRPRVGLAWRAGDWDQRRSIPFELLAPLLDLGGVAWFALQHRPSPAERHATLTPLDVDGIEATARWMRAVDLVITVDSMPAHLAGALGAPVWTLLPCDADWRWLRGRTDSPWYPSMRLFRAETADGWEPLLEQVRAALREKFYLSS